MTLQRSFNTGPSQGEINEFVQDAGKGDIASLSRFLRKYPNSVDGEAASYEFTALMMATSHGRLHTVQYLLDRGADLNKKDGYGRTVLMLAATCGHTDIAKILIECGADTHPKDVNGMTALKYAEYHKLTNTVALLKQYEEQNAAKPTLGETINFVQTAGRGDIAALSRFMDKYPNTVDDGEFTALMMAASYGRLDTVNFLLEKGADTNKKDMQGRTALMLAAGHGHKEIVKTLIECGADTRVKDNNGKTALMRAEECNRPATVVLLKQCEEQDNQPKLTERVLEDLSTLAAQFKDHATHDTQCAAILEAAAKALEAEMKKNQKLEQEIASLKKEKTAPKL